MAKVNFTLIGVSPYFSKFKHMILLILIVCIIFNYVKELYMTTQNKYFDGPICKKCNEVLERYRTKKLEKLLNHMTLGVFQFKRFHCWGCLKSVLLVKRVHSKNTDSN